MELVFTLLSESYNETNLTGERYDVIDSDRDIRTGSTYPFERFRKLAYDLLYKMLKVCACAWLRITLGVSETSVFDFGQYLPLTVWPLLACVIFACCASAETRVLRSSPIAFRIMFDARTCPRAWLCSQNCVLHSFLFPIFFCIFTCVHWCTLEPD